MTPYQHIQTYGAPADLGTAKHLQNDAMALDAEMQQHLATALQINDSVWINAIRVEMSANSAVLVLLAHKFGPPSAEQLQSLQATADNAARCNAPKQARYTRN